MIVLSAAVEWYEEEEEECADAERLANEGSSDNVVEDLFIGKPFATFFERTRQTNKTISKLVESKRKLVFRREQGRDDIMLSVSVFFPFGISFRKKRHVY